MAEKDSSSSVSDVRTNTGESNNNSNRSFVFEIDLNEIPSSPSTENGCSPVREAYQAVRNFLGGPKPALGPPAELVTESRNGSCVCGRVEARGGVLVCDACEKWFHISCDGMRKRQAVVLEDWACGGCHKEGGIRNGGLLDLLGLARTPCDDCEDEASEDSQHQSLRVSVGPHRITVY